jgi:hypothetical protein
MDPNDPQNPPKRLKTFDRNGTGEPTATDTDLPTALSPTKSDEDGDSDEAGVAQEVAGAVVGYSPPRYASPVFSDDSYSPPSLVFSDDDAGSPAQEVAGAVEDGAVAGAVEGGVVAGAVGDGAAQEVADEVKV